ncbi:transcription factor grauzone-like [Musca vetustissima]|uniref:transcription factor grauzone-like n=1 Tax=Musca vetustissima TaxID=27455 RepID=UPI002AB66A2A|nr:transcription factor grauzone-like [Musca vetustissima]
MDICIVCLEYNGDILSRLTAGSTEWTKYNVQHIIEKHLWWWHFNAKNEDTNPKWICNECWSRLWSFHTFFVRVQKSHNLFNSVQFCAEKEAPQSPVDEIKLDNDKEENDTLTAEASLNEDLIPLAKRKRGRPRLQKDNIDCVVIDSSVEFIKQEDSPVDKKLPIGNHGNVLSEALHDLDEDGGAQSDSRDYDNDYQNEESSDNKATSEDEEISELSPIKQKKISRCKTIAHKKKSSADGSSIQLTKKYDEYIAQNHELFCSLCHIPLEDFNHLIVHFRDEHNTKPYVMCCDKKFYKRAVFVDHLHVHKDPNYFKCEHCGKVFANRRCLKNHLEWHDDSRKPRFNCSECGKDFFRRGSLEKHRLLHVPEEQRQFQCNECEKKFASESLRTQHIKVTHLYVKLICDICGKAFRERHSFQRHLAEHTGGPTPNIECDICGMKLTSIYGLNRHKRLRHTEENMQEQVCPHCSKVSPNIAAHKSHIQYSHTMQRRHACHLCEKAFRRPKELKEHLSTHTGEALYTCPHCPRTFISNANMHKHRKNEHPKEWHEARMKRLSSMKIPINGMQASTTVEGN